jgi:hypothetical protein
MVYWLWMPIVSRKWRQEGICGVEEIVSMSELT